MGWDFYSLFLFLPFFGVRSPRNCNIFYTSSIFIVLIKKGNDFSCWLLCQRLKFVWQFLSLAHKHSNRFFEAIKLNLLSCPEKKFVKRVKGRKICVQTIARQAAEGNERHSEFSIGKYVGLSLSLIWISATGFYLDSQQAGKTFLRFSSVSER